MRALYFFPFLLIVTYGKSILCVFLFSCICNKHVGEEGLAYPREGGCFVVSAVQTYNGNLDQSVWLNAFCPPQCLQAPTE